MVVSAVKRAQRARRQREANQHHLVTLVTKNAQQEQRAQKANRIHQKNLPYNSEPIEISDSEKGPLDNNDEAGPCVDPNKPTRLHVPVEVEAINLLDSVEEDTTNILNQGEEDVLRVLWLIENNMADDEDEAEYEEEILKGSLWPVFHKNAQNEAPKVQHLKRKNLNGEIVGYRKLQTDQNSKKLKPAGIPKQTAHSRRVKQKKEAGSNDIRFYLSQVTSKDSSPQPDLINQLNITTAQPPQLSDEEDCSLLKSQSDTEANNERDLWIQKKVDDYRAAASKNDREVHSKQQSQMASIEQRWIELDKALNQSALYYKEVQRKDPTFQFPTAELGEIREFNTRRRELEILGSKSPAVAASLMTSESSIRRGVKYTHLSSKFPLTGLGRSRYIRSQANNILKFRKLLESEQGKHSPHPSMIDNEQVSRALMSWATSKKPGEVDNIWYFCLIIHS
ncbi:hypothetical protein DFH28DRAFT_1109414 [Melampsora americana]|nr:hypothetical protein DFH28DRAFT_1109414 [Melampsora americana]